MVVTAAVADFEAELEIDAEGTKRVTDWEIRGALAVVGELILDVSYRVSPIPPHCGSGGKDFEQAD